LVQNFAKATAVRAYHFDFPLWLVSTARYWPRAVIGRFRRSGVDRLLADPLHRA